MFQDVTARPHISDRGPDLTVEEVGAGKHLFLFFRRSAPVGVGGLEIRGRNGPHTVDGDAQPGDG